MKIKFLLACCVALLSVNSFAQNNVAEEIAWVVGDEPIFKSDIEEQYLNLQSERAAIDGNPYCVIPEQMALNKLFLHQAKIDTVVVQESQIAKEVDSRINFFIANLGSKEKVEEYFHKPLPVLREKIADMFRDQYSIQQVQNNLTKKIKATPSEVRKFFNTLPADSLPFIPKQVEVQIITINPVIPQQEIDEVKSRLRDYAQRITNGEAEFSTMAILYSEDKGTAVYGGETGFQNRSVLLPEYATAAFNLNDTKKVSNIVETEDGYHIIQLIEKRGDRINTRHILLRPKVSDKDLTDAIARLDTLKNEITEGKVTFEQAAFYVSQDKDSRNNNGIMLNEESHSNLFQMSQLPPEVGKIIDKMEVGELSEPFLMINAKTQREQVAIVKLNRRIEGHKADLADDYQTLKGIYEEHKRGDIIENWIKQKQKSTYVYIEDNWRNCEFKYDWLHKGATSN
ncbi:MAG: peptidylprolyl isomerase [Bacteroidales bacterium]|uniref:peptidylprolyl isomerase n=1 Tax=Sodaliphilus sp. TaxID=2815818 RepID=UPI001B72BBD5|nr:peptidylprolyl isomerase [Candidatus Sodaliphilus limicaballi]